jgi:CheY-like chemotaxis protein
MKTIQILVVEDERIVADDIKMSLQRLGYVVSGMASSGEEAVKKAESMQPDLVLMDIVLEKKMSGIEAASIISSRFNIPIRVLKNSPGGKLKSYARRNSISGTLFTQMTKN